MTKKAMAWFVLSLSLAACATRPAANVPVSDARLTGVEDRLAAGEFAAAESLVREQLQTNPRDMTLLSQLGP